MKMLIQIALAILFLFSINTSALGNSLSVTLAGSFQDELGCSGDWQPDCAATALFYDPEDDIWQEIYYIPAGSWEYKAAINGSWDENYGNNAQKNGANISLNLSDYTDVKFYYDEKTHWITDDVTSTIAVVPGSFQDEMGCPGEWDPSCFRSWLQDPEGDGIYSFTTQSIPAGSYEARVAIDESWSENYGAEGVHNGPNILFTVLSDCEDMQFVFDNATKVLNIAPAPPEPQPSSVTLSGSFQDELGCPGDWQPDCAAVDLVYDAEDGVWKGIFMIPAGSWEYKAAINHSWDENYGANALLNGPNISLDLTSPADVRFYYDNSTHWITDTQDSIIATVPGSFQSELGCDGDWDPSCLLSWLQDPDGDGIFSFSARLPAGNYEAKIAIDESWAENYGAEGIVNGPNIPFSVPLSCKEILFSYDSATHILRITHADGSIDFDGDGFVADEDCNDDDADIYPGAAEFCDGVDNNCDGEIDEGYDIDSDGISDCFDNCPNDENFSQEDSDGDTVGDACDICPNDADNDADGDSICGDIDACPSEDATGFDMDADGCLDNFAGLTEVIHSLVFNGVIDQNLADALIVKIANAEKSNTKDNICAAVNQLGAFQNQIEAKRGNPLTNETADRIIQYAENIILQLTVQLSEGESCG